MVSWGPNCEVYLYVSSLFHLSVREPALFQHVWLFHGTPVRNSCPSCLPCLTFCYICNSRGSQMQFMFLHIQKNSEGYANLLELIQNHHTHQSPLTGKAIFPHVKIRVSRTKTEVRQVGPGDRQKPLALGSKLTLVPTELGLGSDGMLVPKGKMFNLN